MTDIRDATNVQSKVRIEGECNDQFAPVREAFALNLESGQDIGASVSVFVDGEPVVDLRGGYMDATYTRPFDRHTRSQEAPSW
jgi:CubicO group peptidase (beta-lactamase class C family)